MDARKNEFLEAGPSMQQSLAALHKCGLFLAVQADNGDVFKDKETGKLDGGVENEGVCMELFDEMHAWPDRLNEILDRADDAHHAQRERIIKEV